MTTSRIALIALATALAGGAAGYLLRGATPAGVEAAHADEKGGDSHADEHGAKEHAEGGAKAEPSIVQLTTDQIRAAGIETAAIASSPLTGEIIASGRIVPAQSSRAEVTARTSGVVVRLLRRLGDPVEAGTPLAQLDSREVAEAQAAYARASRDVDLARAAFRREQTLFEQKVTARADYEQAGAALDTATIARDAAAEGLRALGATPGGGSRLTQLRSPIGGRVTAVETTPGAYVNAETKLFEVASQATVWVELNVPGGEVLRVRQGQRVEVMPQGEAHTHSGRLQFVSPAIDPVSGAAKAVVELANPAGELAIGKLVTARILTTDDGPSGLMAPRDAIQEVEGRTVVFVRVPNGFEARPVTVRPGTSALVAVLSGLRPGEQIAVVNSFILKAELMKGEAEHDH